MNDVIEVWSRSRENLEAIACIVLETLHREAANLDTHVFQKMGVYCGCYGVFGVVCILLRYLQF